MSLCSIAFVGYIQVRSGGCWLRSGSFGSFWSAIVFAGFIRLRSVHSHAPCCLLCSFGFIRFIRVRPRGWSGSFSSFRCALGVVGLICVC